MIEQLPAPAGLMPSNRLLTTTEFHRLADAPPEIEWFANISNAHTRRAYENAVRDFMQFAGISRPEEFRTVTRAHIVAWRDDLGRRGLGGSTTRHRLASLASLFEYLCERNALTHNPVKGVERPRTESGEGKTPALGDHQARKLLAAPEADTIKSKRDRAILSTLLFHALRREELCKLKVKDVQHARKVEATRRGICRCIPEPKPSSTTTLRPPATARTKMARFSGRPATTAPASSTTRSRRTASYVRPLDSIAARTQQGGQPEPHGERVCLVRVVGELVADVLVERLAIWGVSISLMRLITSRVTVKWTISRLQALYSPRPMLRSTAPGSYVPAARRRPT
jgi:Phage integrase, N-terminal SAM-like domain